MVENFAWLIVVIFQHKAKAFGVAQDGLMESVDELTATFRDLTWEETS